MQLASTRTHTSLSHAQDRTRDGNGYPDGRGGGEIPVEARIIFACDAYSAMTSDRAQRAAVSHADAIVELRRCAGMQFDPVVVETIDALSRLRA